MSTFQINGIDFQFVLLHLSTSARLTIVANIAIATGPALLGAPRFFVLNLFLIICKSGYYNLGVLSERESKFYTCYTENFNR